MNKLFRRDRARSSNDSELDSWLCDDHSHRSMRQFSVSASAASTAKTSTEPAAPERASSRHRQVVTYLWDSRFSQALEFGRRAAAVATPTSTKHQLTVVHWRPSSETLGITLDVETTTRQIIVIASTRRDIRAGAILVRIAGQSAREDTFRSLLATVKHSRGVTAALEFAPAPAPVVVTKRNFELAMLGVDQESFELVAVDGVRVRYLSLQDISWLILESSNQHYRSSSSSGDNNNNDTTGRDRSEMHACEMVFERFQPDSSQQQQQNRRARDSASAGSSGVVTAMAAVAAISSALS